MTSPIDAPRWRDGRRCGVGAPAPAAAACRRLPHLPGNRQRRRRHPPPSLASLSGCHDRANSEGGFSDPVSAVDLHAEALQDRVIKEAQTIPSSVGQDDPTVEGEGL